jgi:N-acetylglucosamine-6-phosphate deacetylase
LISGTIAIRTQRLLTPLQDLRGAVVLIEGSKIAAVCREEHFTLSPGITTMDVGDRIVVPGFVDLHIHGALGARANQGVEAVRTIAQHLVTTGTTSWLPTVETLADVAGIIEASEKRVAGADILGVHMEGPFLAPKNVPGNEVEDRMMRRPSIDLFRQLLAEAKGTLRLMGISPELDGAFDLIREMRRGGVIPAVAHTRATYEQFMRAVAAGARHVTHTYNVMTGFHHRKPGVVGGALTCDQVTAELIADGYHVSPVAMDMLIRCKGPENVALISDCTTTAGLPDGTYEIRGRTIVKQDGVSRLAGSHQGQDGTMAGSEWPMNHNIHTVIDQVGLTLRDAIRMATLTPATVIHVDSTKGSIEPGKDADLVVIDEQLGVYLTMVRGEIVFQTGSDTDP